MLMLLFLLLWFCFYWGVFFSCCYFCHCFIIFFLIIRSYSNFHHCCCFLLFILSKLTQVLYFCCSLFSHFHHCCLYIAFDYVFAYFYINSIDFVMLFMLLWYCLFCWSCNRRNICCLPRCILVMLILIFYQINVLLLLCW